jgi:hypothetical protein
MVLFIDIVLITYVTSLSGILIIPTYLSSSFPIAYLPYTGHSARKVIILIRIIL